MKLPDSGHLPTRAGNLETVADRNGPAIRAQDAGVDPPEGQSTPKASEPAQIQCRAREKVWQATRSKPAPDPGAGVVLLMPSSWLRTVIPARQRAIHKKVFSRHASRPQLAHQSSPVVPKHHQPPCRLA
jgi:hypothetical protein